MQSQDSFLLSYIKYGDSDAVLHCFSRENGFESFFCRGVYSPKNRKKAYLFPLNEIRIFILDGRSSSSLKNISKIEQRGEQYSFDNPKLNTVLFFVADFLNQVLRRETECRAVYQEIQSFVKESFAGNLTAHFALVFNMLKNLGIAPLTDKGNFLDPETGTFSDEPLHVLFNEEVSALWIKFSLASNPYEIKLTHQEKKKFLETLMLYYRYHFADFREPASLEVLQQIYD